MVLVAAPGTPPQEATLAVFIPCDEGGSLWRTATLRSTFSDVALRPVTRKKRL